MVNFNIAQTFNVDPSLVDGNDTAKITSIDLFMKYKPPGTNNRSGIDNPGMTLYLTETIYGVPKITNDTYAQFIRLLVLATFRNYLWNYLSKIILIRIV